jgi:DNA modification methylase
MSQEIDPYRNKILQGDCLAVLKTLPSKSVQMCVTSPPYYALRNYNVEGQIGNEPTLEGYVQKMREVFGEVKRVLRDDGILWLNLGDSYAGSGVHAAHHKNPGMSNAPHRGADVATPIPQGLKAKDMCGVPWRVAFALQEDGFWLRNDVIWQKPNPIPFPVTDRLVNSHEYIFLMAKSKKYFYDAYAVKEPVAASSLQRINQPNFKQQNGGDKDYAKTGQNDARSVRKTVENFAATAEGGRNKRDVWSIPDSSEDSVALHWFLTQLRDIHPDLTQMLIDNYAKQCENKTDVWRVTVKGTKEAHFATFNPELIIPCILAGTSAKGACAICGAPYNRVVVKGIDHLTPVESIERCGVKLNPEDSAKVLFVEKNGGQYRISVIGDKHGHMWMDEPTKSGRTTQLKEKGYTIMWWGIIEPTACYNNKQKGVDIGQSPQSFIRDDKIAVLRAKSREDAVKMYPDDTEKQKEYIKFVHDHGCSDPATQGKTVSWSASCACNTQEIKPCIVLDPFMGSGTTAIVAQKFGHDYIGIELNPEYIVMAERRIKAAKEDLDKLKSKNKTLGMY